MANKKEAQVIEFPPSEEVISLDDMDNESDDVVFTISLVPGVSDEVILAEPDEDEIPGEIVMEPEEASQEDIDEWQWEKSHGMHKFLHWLKQMIDNVPSHDGKSIGGLKRAVSYFERLKKEIDKAMSQDFKREIDAAKAEEARDMILDGLDKLNKRLQKIVSKKEKRASEKSDIIKEAETSTTGNIQIVVPYIVSFIARACIDASVQGGKDMKDTFKKLIDEYNVDKREQVQVIQLIKDMNYPLIMDRIRISDGVLDMDGDGEWIKEYQA